MCGFEQECDASIDKLSNPLSLTYKLSVMVY